MVFKPFTHLARQTFAKTFAHGYAQSVVAASQSSFSTTPINHITATTPAKFSRTTQVQNAFQHASSGSSGAGAKTGHGASSSGVNGDSGLAAYYAAWQHAQQTGDDGDWRQFQFSKRIGWKPSETSKEETEAEELERESSKSQSHSVTDPRAKAVESAPVNADVSAQVDEAVAREIEQIQNGEDVDTAAPSVALSSEESALADGSLTELTPSTSIQETSESAVSDVEPSWETVTDRSNAVTQLAHSGQYAKIPAVFEGILREGVTPNADAYNALLEAAIQLHTDTRQAVPKALDVYSDMLRRGAMPNEQTYKSLIQLLATRALDSLNMIQRLEQQRSRFGGLEEPGKFIFHSSELDHQLLAEDHSLPIALKLFNVSTTRHPTIDFSLDVYRTILTACAMRGEVDRMIQIFAHMETNGVAPHASMFPPMIDAFASVGDLKSAVECYNEYKRLAIADDEGVFGIVERTDGEVYAALVRAYLTCGKEEGGQSFLEKIKTSFDKVEDREARLQATEEVVVLKSVIQRSLDAGKFADALALAGDKLQGDNLVAAVSKICVAAADAGDTIVSTKAYELLTPEEAGSASPVVAMLAVHVRQGNLAAAKPLWSTLASSATAANQEEADLIQPTAMYVVALLKSGLIAEGLSESRSMFARIRSAVTGTDQLGQVREEVDEAIDLFGRVLVQSASVIPPQAALTLLRAMVENGGLVSAASEHAIASLGPMGISQLSAQDLTMALQIQAGMMVNSSSSFFDAAHHVRFAHMVDVALSTAIPVDSATSQLVERGIAKLGESRPDLVQAWQAYTKGRPVAAKPASQYASSAHGTPAMKPSRPEDSFDPYANSTDFRGSSIIAEELESTSGRAEDHLNTALTRFRNMRRIGRHPRYITYAKLITAAAKCGRMNLTHEILGTARHDVPLIPHSGAVKYGWTSILDAMVAACLTSGERSAAAKYHQELLSMGAAPSANTFGLYITTLKESTKTFDEATEAVKIFHRATAEGVEPTSFLYNALIGKLGKARRIDDCLQYFAEMRANGVKPTSVTYGTIVNALCRVSDERFAEEMFDEMESMPNYKPRPAPYNSLIQYFLNTKRDRAKVLAYYERMRSKKIQPTMHTYKLLIDAHASLEPVDMDAAEAVLDTIRAAGKKPEAVHYSSLIHAKGCVQNDMAGARRLFDSVISSSTAPQACLYQALFEAMVANHQVSSTPELLRDMARRNVEMTPYIANTLIHGWAAEGKIANAKSVYDGVGIAKREPSTYEAMTRAFLAAEDRGRAADVVQEMLSRGYPAAVAGKLLELVGGGNTPASATASSFN